MKFLLFFLLSFLIYACGAVKFNQVYEGYGAEGFHARGMTSHDSLLSISGAKGKVTIFNLNSLSVVDTFTIKASDFRGVQFVQASTLLLMNSGDRGLIYQYNLATKQLNAVLSQDSAFYDAIAINKSGVGFMMGDPIDNQFTLYKTIDFGKNWEMLDNLPSPLKGEAGFAASNTGIAYYGSTVYFATGASDTARLIKSENDGETWTAINTPMRSGGSHGIYSIAFWSAKNGMIAGGSYVDKLENDSICFITNNGGKTWTNRSLGLPGYTSCVTASQNGKLIVATGRLGVMYSTDKGKTWQALTKQPFYAAKIVGDKICLSGQRGTLSIYLMQ
ncbi:MAG: WD40/YVTN/BNR-like repeat-containing protein [Crocinitomicaceae bacterium]